ncbi:predicted protein [Chaetoceros tenuissimus]|uniref:Uncharacterized protein n=1 Tax=Chaetoceros tenuissimus TaxID=426638 RepID=A0AAD3H2H5_9STRA|nr:predicted protein [Chaetoceros tenuissimus]
MDMTDVGAMRSCKRKKKERHSNGVAARMRNLLAKSPKSPKTATQKESSTMKKKRKNKQKGQCNARTMKKSNKLRALWKGCFVRRSIQTKTQMSSVYQQHIKNGKADHKLVAVTALSSSKSAITSPTISISKTGPDTLLQVVSSSSLSSPPAICLNDFIHPTLQQSNRVKFSEFIFSIPQRALDPSATISLDDCGSNLLHLACFHGSNHDTMRYMFDNCRHDTQLHLLTNTDQDGNLPSHILVSSICRQKIDLDDGLKILKLFYEICPEAIFELNSNEELVTDIAYGFRRNVHEDSSEFLRLDTLYSCLRDMMSQVWLKRKLQWEEMGHEQIDFDAIRIKNIKSYWRSFHDKRDGEWKPC